MDLLQLYTYILQLPFLLQQPLCSVLSHWITQTLSSNLRPNTNTTFITMSSHTSARVCLRLRWGFSWRRFNVCTILSSVVPLPAGWLGHINTKGDNFKKMIHNLWQEPSQCFGISFLLSLNPLNPELNPICYLLALLGAYHFLHVSGIKVKLLTFRRLMLYIYGAPILDVSRSHTTTYHSR